MFLCSLYVVCDVMYGMRGVYVLHKDVKGLARLIERGADIHMTDNDGDTPLHIAALYGRLDAITLLLSNGAQVNQHNHNNDSALSYALYGKQEKAVTLLVQKGADAGHKNMKGQVSSVC